MGGGYFPRSTILFVVAATNSTRERLFVVSATNSRSSTYFVFVVAATNSTREAIRCSGHKQYTHVMCPVLHAVASCALEAHLVGTPSMKGAEKFVCKKLVLPLYCV